MKITATDMTKSNGPSGQPTEKATLCLVIVAHGLEYDHESRKSEYGFATILLQFL